jgi:DNA-3-methyladenine glycosylase II
MKLPVGVRPPFDFQQSLAFLRRFEACRDDYVIDERSVTAAISIGGRAVPFRIEAAGDGVAVDVPDGLGLTAAARTTIARTAAHLLGADDDVTLFYARAEGDHPAFLAIVRALYGLHHVRFLTLAEIAVYCVLMQRAPINQAARAKRRFLESFGRPVTVDGRVLHAMPALDELTALGVPAIREAIRHPGKAAVLPGVIRGVAELGEDFLRTAPYDDARAALVAIPGIGPFSAAAILLRGLGRMDDVPLEGPSFAEPARVVYGTAWDPRATRARYGDSVGYWSYYLKTGEARGHHRASRGEPVAELVGGILDKRAH